MPRKQKFPCAPTPIYWRVRTPLPPRNFHFLAMNCTFLMYTHSMFDLNLFTN